MSNEKKLTEEEMKKAACGFTAQRAGYRTGTSFDNGDSTDDDSGRTGGSLGEDDLSQASGGFSAQRSGDRSGIGLGDTDGDGVVEDPDVRRGRGPLPS